MDLTKNYNSDDTYLAYSMAQRKLDLIASAQTLLTHTNEITSDEALELAGLVLAYFELGG